MSVASYLISTSQGFFFRMRVPKDLQPILKKRELKRAIKTTSRIVAERQAIVYAAKAIELFSSLQEVPLADILFTTIRVAEAERRPDGTIKIKGVEMDPDKPEAELKLYNNMIERLAALPMTTTPVAPPTTTPPKKLMLSEAVDRFMKHRRERALKQGVIFDEKAARVPFVLLTEFLGGDKPIVDITEDDAQLFYEKLKLLPAIRTGNDCKGLSFLQLITMDVDKISINTHGQHIGKISGLWHHLNDKKILMVENPFFGMADKKVMHAEAAIKKRQAFDATDVQKIFKHPIWTEKAYEDIWEYWLPLILIHSGARTNEIVQMEKKDVVKIDGIWCLSINDLPTKDEPDDVWEIAPKRVKTANSRREIPIHHMLFKLGFLNFVDSIKSGRLFPDIEPIAHKLAATPCKRFNERRLVEMGVKVTKKKTFYSLRHTVMNELKRLRVVPEERGQLAGHSPQQKITEGYGNEFPLEDMQALVERLDFSYALQNTLPWVSNPTIPTGCWIV
jgi:integrase